MKQALVSTILLCLAVSSVFSQKDEVLFTINNKPTYVSEFKHVYEKNLNLVEELEAKDVNYNLDLFINYKLKVQEAYNLKLDTANAYKKELATYKNQLIAPYLQDDELVKNQVQEAYDRTLHEVRASHMLVMFPNKEKTLDTLSIITTLNNARDRVLKGESFEKVAREVSQDPSVKINGGDLGYFSAFRMVFPFEEAAFTTKVGEVSKPFKTRFGYHILQVTDKRKSKGEFEVAHILVSTKKPNAKTKIDSVYHQLQNGISFAELAKTISEDKGSAKNEGKLPKFGTGKMVAPFENAVLALEDEGDFSQPFQTNYGWHIVKLLKKYPIKPFSELEDELTRKVKSDERAKQSKESVIIKLRQKYSIKVDENSATEVLKSNKVDDKKLVLIINDKKLYQNDFYHFSKYRKNKSANELIAEFTNQEVLTYFKENIENTEPEFKNTFKEYKDGLLLFELLQDKIWKKSATDSIGLTNYYHLHKNKYKGAELDKVRGQVISDYQKQLEDNWITELRKKNVVAIRKRALAKLKQNYNQ